MNKDIRVLTSFKGHRKRKRLVRELGFGAEIYLLDLWLTVAMDSPEGILTGWDEIDIADAAGWDDEPEIFIDALINSLWLEKNSDGEYILHDWCEHQGWACKAKERSIAAKKAAEARWNKKNGIENKGLDSNADSCGAHAEGNAPSPSPKPNPTHINNAKKVIDKLNSLSNKSFKYSKSSTENIIARFKDGFTLDECLKVLEIKIKDKYFMENPKYYSPITLFRPKNFEKYLNEIPKVKQVIDICLDQKTWENSRYQSGGEWKTSNITYVNFTHEFIDDDEREEVELNTAKFISEFCEGGF